MGNSTKTILWHLLVEEEGPIFAEYGLLLALIPLLVLLLVVTLGEGISTFFQRTAEAFTGATIPTISKSIAFSCGGNLG